jgi:hypothetical protein
LSARLPKPMTGWNDPADLPDAMARAVVTAGLGSDKVLQRAQDLDYIDGALPHLLRHKEKSR